ncbi:aminotransferase class III-fold pyridoxal phosphate-dependent enzyme [Streptomyces sp. NPDC001508]|uniref:aminotransferase class III-fold pyridoxal phosphate-dependent enzyme n=1 Tax=Streptomyces sp. NPDC001508 TaxID=3154656 RepID=UPI00332958AF
MSFPATRTYRHGARSMTTTRSDSAPVPPRVRVPEGTVIKILRDHYGLDVANLETLAGETDHNLRARLADDSSVMVKVGRRGTDGAAQAWHWQHTLIDAIARKAPDIPVSEPLHTTDGHKSVSFSADNTGYALQAGRWLEGRILADLPSHSPHLLQELGRTAARLVTAISELPAPNPQATHNWDLLTAPDTIRAQLTSVTDPEHRALAETVLTWFENEVTPRLDALPRANVHHDLNDFNVLAIAPAFGEQRISGIVDFGDALRTARISELAVAGAYAMLRKEDPIRSLADVVAGWAQATDSEPVEIDVVYPLAAIRLVLNAVTWTHRSPGHADPYARSRSRHTWPALRRLVQIPPARARILLHAAARLPAPKTTADLTDRLARTPASPVTDRKALAVDLSVTSTVFDGIQIGDAKGAHRAIHDTAGGCVPVGPHLKSRFTHVARRRTTTAPEPATLHLGCDLHLESGEAVQLPHEGTAQDPAGPDLVIRHELPDAPVFWARWRGLVHTPAPGTALAAGDDIGHAVGPVTVALFTDRAIAYGADDTYIPRWQAPSWQRISPDPSPYLGIAADDQTAAWDITRVQTSREAHFGRSQRSYYRRPMNLVRGRDTWLYDEDGLGYLDPINNVTHVGHGNPRVARAATRQLHRLNTNSRFVYDGIARYAERLAATLPDPLEVVFLVCSGSEANDLALRISRQVTGRQDIMVIDGAYHGNTSAVTAISPNRYKGPGGSGTPATTHEVPLPDRYRGRYGYDDHQAGARYAQHVDDVATSLTVQGRPPAAFFAESLMGTAGNIPHPDGYLREAFAAVRRQGGFAVSDEVQVGFGRTGDTFWCFESQNVVPDIVTMGKPIGNGHPMAALVTTREIADAFDTGMKYFNTFGGNPVSCEIGLAVLDEIEERSLQQNAAAVGGRFLHRLRELAEQHEIIGDVRGRGLYLGIELVRDRTTREPAAAEAMEISERLKDEGVISYPTGVHDNVLKLKPPMTITDEDVDVFVTTLDGVLHHG